MINKKIKIKIKLTPRKITAWFYIFIIFITAVTLAVVTLFLYKNFYQTITQSNEIIVLRQKVVVETVDMNKFTKILDKISQKIKLRKIENINNPF